MPLVEYSSSEDSSKERVSSLAGGVKHKPLKRKRHSPITINEDLPPLPDSFHDLYASSTRLSTQDDPTLHGGRQRVTPHVEGNWPSHVYIEWRPSRTESEKFQDVLTTLRSPARQINSLLQSDLGAPLPLHISLSRSIALLTDQRKPFLSSFQKSISVSAIRPFTLAFKSLAWVPNHECTRWFLVLSVAKPTCNSLNRILHVTNATAEVFGLPTLYAPPTQPIQKPSSQPQGQDRNGRDYRHDKRGRGNYLTMTNNGRGGRDHGYDKRGRGGRSTIASNENSPIRTVISDYSEQLHVSLAWSLEPPSQEEAEKTANIDFSKLEDMKMEVNAVKAKIGNVIHVVSLRRTTGNEGGMGIIGVQE